MKELRKSEYYPSMEIAKRWYKHFFEELSEKIKDINRFAVMRYAYTQQTTKKEKYIFTIDTYLIDLMLKGDIKYKREIVDMSRANAGKVHLVLGGSILDYEAKYLRVKKSATEEERRTMLKKWLDEQPKSFNPFSHDMTKKEVWDACGISDKYTDKYTDKTSRTFSEYNRDLILYKRGRRGKKRLNTPKPKNFNKNNPAIMPLNSKT